MQDKDHLALFEANVQTIQIALNAEREERDQELLSLVIKGSDATQFKSVVEMQLAYLHKWWKEAEQRAEIAEQLVLEMREILRTTPDCEKAAAKILSLTAPIADKWVSVEKHEIMKQALQEQENRNTDLLGVRNTQQQTIKELQALLAAKDEA